MVDREPQKKRKATSKAEEDASNQSIEGLEAFKELHASWPHDMLSLLSSVGIKETRRQELWELVADQASEYVDKYAWAVPDERALRILDNFSPIIEIGAGAGYWAYCMRKRGIECIAYDLFPPLTLDGSPRTPWTEVEEGGPEQLQTEENQGKTLLLCYPDDFENEGKSLAAECLQMLQSDFVVHCGELFGDTASLDHAPWGRTTAASAQQHLFSLFRCVMKVPLPSWPHCNDHLTVWRRMDTCHVQNDTERKQINGKRGAAESETAEGEQPKRKTPKSSVPDKDTAETNGTKINNDNDGGSEEGDGKEELCEYAQQRNGPNSSNGEDEEQTHSGDEGDTMEFICDAEQYSLGSAGWALPFFTHLL